MDDFTEDLTEFFKLNSMINKMSAFELNKKNKIMSNQTTQILEETIDELHNI